MGGERGFALVAALLAVWILTAVGVLVFTMTTQDVRISSRMVGEKKAFYATEAGVHSLTQVFDPLNLTDPAKYGVEFTVDTSVGGDARTKYTIQAPRIPDKGPGGLPLAGYAVGGGQQWGVARYTAEVSGRNTGYNSMVTVNAGLGFGPVEITTAYR